MRPILPGIRLGANFPRLEGRPKKPVKTSIEAAARAIRKNSRCSEPHRPDEQQAGRVRVRSDENTVTSDEIGEVIREMGYSSDQPEGRD